VSWIQRLVETYDACVGRSQFADRPLVPIDHVEQNAHIEIAIDENGNFLRAAVVQKEPTLIPVTEKSAGRTQKPVAHPLSDKIRYIAKDFGSDDHKLYLIRLKTGRRVQTMPRFERSRNTLSAVPSQMIWSVQVS
jgi:hypothetical protein